MVLGDWSKSVTVRDDYKIVRDKRAVRVLTTLQAKEYKIVFDKRVVIDDYQTISYGY